MIKVQPFSINEQPANSVEEEKLQNEDHIMNRARLLNKIARTVFIILLAIFNVGYWSVAYLEHFRPAEYYIMGKN